MIRNDAIVPNKLKFRSQRQGSVDPCKWIYDIDWPRDRASRSNNLNSINSNDENDNSNNSNSNDCNKNDNTNEKKMSRNERLRTLKKFKSKFKSKVSYVRALELGKNLFVRWTREWYNYFDTFIVKVLLEKRNNVVMKHEQKRHFENIAKKIV